ncbi:arsenate reductase (glutaredoxin) [Myroides ceti]|uniref:Arsenate reductase (Glutaredoxin) n=1 Tax=Paenimyroides ceti TaxID=395087 RepID=A0ABT8D0A1_9FLAO|nr:arsenate reductase (glutaredoxin) [Paenimyroides ceti]MDN3707722.1 arsenate reductase (glutaredoxin) [Paenimyroides ceti]MDN3709886.1 arsenate reductase (glutaredoxin) [Paenimyroides ceti]MDN3709894.1 arsenate reductase (glutaredoxin) [Paenimyroides ceti]MDN3709904.1 arsenate reductase (glutaredoxin) [Paenimyroides ceti]
MITIYHNPRCSKSREGLAYLEDKKVEVDVIKYLDEPISKETLKHLIALLNIKPIELVRTKEAEWADYKNQQLSDDAIIEAMVKHPKLIERPIVVNGNKAVIARPFSKIEDIL